MGFQLGLVQTLCKFVGGEQSNVEVDEEECAR